MGTTATEQSEKGSASSMVEVFMANVRERADKVAARYKADDRWQEVTWGKYGKEVAAAAGGLLSLGVEPGDRVSIISNTRWEYITCQFAILSAGAVVQPIYQTLPAPEIEYILNDAGSVVVFAENTEQLAKLMEIRENIPNVRRVVLIAGESDSEWVLSFEQLKEVGRDHMVENPESIHERTKTLTPDDNLLIMYTSGTTGPPKGVVLSHDGMVYEGECVVKLRLMSPDTIQLLFLPLAHAFAQVMATTWVQTCHTLALAEGLDKIVPNMAEVRPTMMGSVPRIFEKVYTKVVSAGLEAGGIKAFLFKKALQQSEKAMGAEQAGRPHGGFWWWLANRAVFPKLNERFNTLFGGRLEYFISGGAPLSKKIAYFFKHAGVKILEGYGLTETSAGTCVNLLEKNRLGTVGPPMPGTKCKIADDGEILFWGRGVMKEYWNLPEATTEVFSEEVVAEERIRWFHTGDIGELDEEGFLKITGRKKDIIVTAGGKNIAPQHIENLIKTSPYISNVVVHGDKRKFCSALITLDAEIAANWAIDRGLLTETEVLAEARKALEAKAVSTEGLDRAATLAKAAPLGGLKEPVRKIHDGQEVTALIQEELDRLNTELPSYETIKKFKVLETDFEIGDILTPTLKVKRRLVAERFKDIFDSFYEEAF